MRFKLAFKFEVHPQMGPLRKMVIRDLIHIKNWVLFEIQNTKKTEQVLKQFFYLAKELHRLNNWHSLQSIISSLMDCYICYKYKPIFTSISADDLRWFYSIRDIFLDEEALRRTITDLPNPCVPALEVYISTIQKYDKEQGPPMKSETLINFQWLEVVGSVIGNFVRCQEVHPVFERIPFLQQYLAIERPLQSLPSKDLPDE